MGNLITAQQVIELAFSAVDQITPSAIKETKIDAAQETFLRPALGDLYAAMLDGRYPDFVKDYICPALAYYVRYAVIPDLALKLNNSGAQVMIPMHSNAATDKQRTEMRQQAKTDADALLDKATRFLCDRADEFPEYDPQRNIRNRTNTNGGIIL